MNIVDFDYFLDREPAVRVQGRPRRGLEIDGEHWFLRFPKDKSSNKDVLAEYIGSHIYGILGYPVSKTILGTARNSLVVACSDVLNTAETYFDFELIKNGYNPENIHFIRERSSERNLDTDLYSTLSAIRENMKDVDGAIERFWDMFVVDAFIYNSSRSNKSWGYLYDGNTHTKRLAPIFDNSNAFTSEESSFEIKNKKIRPVGFMKNCHSAYPELEEAILRNSRRIREKRNEIQKMIHSIHETVSVNDSVYSVLNCRHKEILTKLLDIKEESLRELADEIEQQRKTMKE